ncbi:MAG: M42 family metallopeptidase, partial [Clostridiales bacterium]|nr:M42 family metallopeptidase [Clostridiales bacterium]
LKVLETLCSAAGVGSHPQAAEIAADCLRDFCDEVQQDSLGSVVGFRRCGQEQAPLILLEAHIDEVGFVVTGIDSNGFIRVAKCGGADVRVISATEVIVWGDKPFPGVFCSLPPHLSKAEDRCKAPELSDLGIDLGMDHEQARCHISEGDMVTFRPGFQVLGGDRVCSKSLDDRAGVASILYCLDQLKDRPLLCDLAVVFAVQEELGCRGSAAAAYAVAPDGAIAVDVSFAWTPDADRHRCGLLDGGPMIGRAPGLNARLSDRLIELAGALGIPCQTEVMGGDTGTDADSIASSRAGVPTALLSIPLRYMHTPSEVVSLRDIENTGRLMAAMIEKEGTFR